MRKHEYRRKSRDDLEKALIQEIRLQEVADRRREDKIKSTVRRKGRKKNNHYQEVEEFFNDEIPF